MKNQNETVMLLLEIDPEKKIFYISNYDGNSENGLARSYRNRKDIIRIFKNFLFNNVNLYPLREMRRDINGRNRRKN